MESLDNTEWDVIIAGTGLAESLLALSLSRSDKKVLHLDRNPYYGGDEAALSLDEAEEWASQYSGAETSRFSHASIWRPSREDGEPSSVKLASSRAYALALGPQIVYAVSKLVSSLVSSQTSGQLEFQAVGSWFIMAQSPDAGPSLTKVPNGREDVFSDSTLDLRAKRSLMKFLRFVATYEEQGELWEDVKNLSFSTALEQKFGLPAASHDPLIALTLSSESPRHTLFADAVPAVARHLRSIGVFGPGFGAVVPKWGGLAEITQVACRACAVGGGVYVLNKSWQSVSSSESGDAALVLTDNEKVRSKFVVKQKSNGPDAQQQFFAHSITIVSGTLTSLFPLTSEGGVTPAAAVIVVPSSTNASSPVYIQVHSSEAGECPSSQCVLYASSKTSENEDSVAAFQRLQSAVSDLLQSVDPESQALWRLQYLRAQAADPLQSDAAKAGNGVIEVPSLDSPVVFEDSLLEGVKEAWKTITGEDEQEFLTFAPREGNVEEE